MTCSLLLMLHKVKSKVLWYFIYVYIINRTTLHDRCEKYSRSETRALIKCFSTLEEKWGISKQPCNILYISVCVGVLSKVRHLTDNLILVILYYSLIYPFLTYGDHVWGLTFPSFLTQLCSIQKKAVNNIFFWTKIPFWAFVQISQLTWAQWCHLITGIHFCLSVVMRTVTSQFQWIFQIYLFCPFLLNKAIV